ncbi:MAG: DUF2569 family protein [Acidobacteria bacterium]|nr:DUF2569 family protein [Acidobacteriota bacterium]
MTQLSAAEAEVYPPLPEKKKVGGWLLVLCVGLTILTPAAGLYGLVVGWRVASPLFAKVPGLESLMILNSMLELVLISWACVVGIKLWGVKEGAVAAVRGFMTATVVLRGLLFLVVAFSPVRGVGLPAFVAFIQAIIFASIWKSYLTNSKRVKATFAETPQAPPDLQPDVQ